MKRNNLFLLLLSCISPLSLFALFSKADVSSIIQNMIIGLIVGILFFIFRTNLYTYRKTKILPAGLSVLFLVLIGRDFYGQFAALEKVISLSSAFDMSSSVLILCILVILFLFSFMLVYKIADIICDYAVYIIGNFRFSALISRFLKSLHRFPKAFAKSFFILVLCSIIGLATMSAVFTLKPTSAVSKHLEDSAALFNSEGMYLKKYDWCQSRMDNYTDSIMITAATDNTDASLIDKSMLIYRGSYDEKETPLSWNIVRHNLNREDYTGTDTYARYWHGYIIFLRPLMFAASYGTIRLANGVTQTILLLCLCYLMYKNKLKRYIIPLVVSLLMISPWIIAESLQFSSCYYISLLSMICVLLFDKKEVKLHYLFLLFGVATSFFDFLTYPVATFAMPAIIYTLLHIEDKKEDIVFSLFTFGVSWCFGYIGMWASKWIYASLLTSENVIADAINSLLFRSSGTDNNVENISRFVPVVTNVQKFFFTPFKYLLFIVILTNIAILLKNKTDSVQLCSSLYNCLPIILLSLLPLIWYIAIANHSAIHDWFTNKALIATCFAFLCTLANLSSDNN